MRRSTIISALVAVTALVAVASGPAAGADLSARAAPDTSVKLVDCSRSGHSAVFYARMRRLAGARRMWLRYTLLERGGGAGFERVRAEGLGRWHKSRRGVRSFGYRQEVRNLSSKGVYRALVEYRWYDKRGELMRQVGRRSSPCKQFTALPNVRASVVGANPTNVPGVLRYGVRVTNSGSVPAGNVAVSLAVDGAALDTKAVALAAGANRMVFFRGPACGRSVSAVADPAGLVAESNEGDNSNTLACADLPRR